MSSQSDHLRISLKATIFVVLTILPSCAGFDAAKFFRTAEVSSIQSSETTVSIPSSLPVEEPATLSEGMPGSDSRDDLSMGKQHFVAKNYGLAEQHFRLAVEKSPKDGEAWLGLAAAYDRLKRFDLADRAYAQALSILGPSVDVLNNQGYSYMLRGEFRQARQKLVEAQRQDPANAYVKSNMELLENAIRMGKGVNNL